MLKRNRALNLVEVCVGIVVLSIAITAIVQIFYFSSLVRIIQVNKFKALGLLEFYVERTLNDIRCGVPPATSLSQIPSTEASYTWSVSGNGSAYITITKDWYGKSLTRRNQESISFLATTFVFDKEMRTTQEREPLVKISTYSYY